MAMYAIATIPLIERLDHQVKQVWYADDATAGGKLHNLRSWWDQLVTHGPEFGYHSNALKTWLVVKPELLQLASDIFGDSGVKITVEGRRHLGAALGTRSFVEAYVTDKVKEWVGEVVRLSLIAASQPQVAYAALTHGLISKWTYLQRTVAGIGDLLTPLEEAIRHKLLHAVIGRTGITDLERNLLELPSRLGGLGVVNPTKSAEIHNGSSLQVTAPLATLIVQQQMECTADVRLRQRAIRQSVRLENRKVQCDRARQLHNDLPPELQKAREFASEKGASRWLMAFPLAEYNFDLPKGEFRDAIFLRYGWKPSHLPSQCVCGCNFTVEHAFSCPCGGLPSIRHNNIRDLTAKLLTEVCQNVTIEPTLQPLTGETLTHRTSISDDNARLDVYARGFWGNRQGAFFDVRVFNPLAPSNCRSRCHVQTP